jgi:hypothetical protein
MESQKSIVVQWLVEDLSPPVFADEGHRLKPSKRKIIFKLLACYGVFLGFCWKSSSQSGVTLGVRRESS